MAKAKKLNQNELIEDRYKYHAIKGDLVELWLDKNAWIAVPTNGSVNKQGLAVMGAGIAKEVAEELPNIRKQLGRRLRLFGNNVNVFPPDKIITVPVKHKWEDLASVDLISLSLARLNGVLDHSMLHYGNRIDHLYVPLLGCGNGGLNYKTQVEPLVVKYLGNDSRFTVVFLPEAYEEHYGIDGKPARSGSRGRTRDAFCERVPPSDDR